MEATWFGVKIKYVGALLKIYCFFFMKNVSGYSHRYLHWIGVKRKNLVNVSYGKIRNLFPNWKISRKIKSCFIIQINFSPESW